MKVPQKFDQWSQYERCDALNANGRRCRADAVRVLHYHGDGEIYSSPGDQPQWVRVAFCAKHAGKEQP